MFNKQIYANSRPNGIGLMEIATVGQEAQEKPLFVPLRHTKLCGQVTGPLADLRLVQTYGYSREQCDQVVEAVYRFPLPGDAAVTGVRVRFGLTEIVTELKERVQAETEYKEAVQQGKQAALLTRESPDVFTLRVAGIQPDEDVMVETRYVQLARPQNDCAGWLLRVPLTTAPRFVREDEINSRYAQGQPLALLRDPGHRFSLDLLVCDAGEVSSPTHQIDALAEGADQRIRLHDEAIVPDRDFVVAWTPRQEADRPSLNVLLHHDQASGQVYFLALVAPPSAYEPGSGVPREVILLVDHSGSMGGAKWEASDWAVNSFLSGLNPHDWFNLGLFYDTTQWFADKPKQAIAAQVEEAKTYLIDNRESGGTELGVALEQALKLERVQPKSAGQELVRHVLIVTDAEVSDAQRILRLADGEAGRPDRRRISVLCIDAAPNAFLATELAERGGGLAHFLTSSPEEDDITTALEEVLADWAEPVLAGLKLEIDRGGGEAAGRDVSAGGGKTAIDLGDLPCGRAIWVAGRAPGKQGETISFDLTSGKTQVASCTSGIAGNVERPALKALFGARRLLGLEYLMGAMYDDNMLKEQLQRLGYDPDQIVGAVEPSLYAENTRRSLHEALKPLLVRESLAYGIACAETAFVAVRTEAGKPIEASVAVANVLPSGWSEDFATASKTSMATLGTGIGSGLGIGVGMAAMMNMPGLQPAAAPVSAPPPGDLAAPPSPPSAARIMQPPSGARIRKRSARADKAAGGTEVFSGVPSFVNGQAILFDSAPKIGVPFHGVLPGDVTITRIEVHFAGQPPKPENLPRELALLIFVGDMAMPRARIRLADLVRGGGRPLNLLKKAGQAVRIVLADPRGAWAAGAPSISVNLTV